MCKEWHLLTQLSVWFNSCKECSSGSSGGRDSKDAGTGDGLGGNEKTGNGDDSVGLKRPAC